MLRELKIENLAIIDELDIEFDKGFIVLTGETGAGKSIILSGINLLIGEKASVDMIRDGEENLVAQGVFDVDEEQKKALEVMGIDIDGEEIIIRRSYSRSGKARAFVNNVRISLTDLKEIASTLVDIVGQHSHQMLLNKNNHIKLLDSFLNKDEKDLNNIITKHLKKNNFSVDSVFDGEEALEYLNYGDYDVIILDVMMPKMNGYEVVKNLRANKNETAVLMLTARDGIDEKIKGLDLGADDYLVKPFDFRELIARIRALVRRKYGNISNELQIDDLIVDISKKSVTRAGKNIELTGKEYEVLEYLIQNKGRVLSRDKIRDGVWDYAYEGESNIIDVLIKNIRKKIDIGDSKPIIHTKRGLGYVLKEDE